MRLTRGIALPTARVLYLIGNLDGGKGLKIIAIDRPGVRRQVYAGLLMSFEDSEIPVTARVVMKESAHRHSKYARIAIYPETQLQAELGKDLKKLRHMSSTKAAVAMFREKNGSARRSSN